MLKNILLIATVILIYSCSDNPQKSNQSKNTESKIETSSENNQNGEALALLKTNCYACHNPYSNSHDNILAPPMVAVKYKYKKTYDSRDEFISKMVSFVVEPSKDNAIMKGPIKRFGLMPAIPTLKEDQAKEIVSYIFDNNIEKPEWFAEHFEEEHGTPWKD